ncbi:MAG: nucleoid-associated protein, partial [Coriobacteriaceae bacterium]|nr:nucleoid-associated protein [Coriobacteriaceae bacterium]
MLHLNHAIMHVIDFNSCVNVYSQEELDINAKWPKGYCTKHAKKALGSIENMRGSFAPESAFAEELRAYFKGERDFVDLSCQIAEFIAGELTRMEKPVSTDVLVIDFEDDPKPPSPTMTEEEIERAYQAKGSRYFALFLLESKPAYMHEAGTGDTGGTAVSIKRHFAILPNPSQKISSYALVERGSMDVLFVDKPRTIAGEERMLIPDGLLQCSKEASSKEV